MTDWKQAAITAGHNEARARQAEERANFRFWLLVAVAGIHAIVELLK
jgi:hypothetical protein